ncbi:MAG: Gfo/Idh/MocA family protein, partial [Velocimicrobium sp.]
MKKWTMGVLGLGEGRSIISAVLNSEQWELKNICDLNQALCIERMKEFGFDRYTTDYEDMLCDPSIDVIGIYTPDQLHGKHIKMALEAGKHVICTKPILVSLDEANELMEIQKSTRKTVFIGQSSRYFEPAVRQREDFLSGMHGELTHIETHYITDARWFLNKQWSREKGFSWMYNFLIHAVDLAVWYLPEIKTVYGMGYVSDNTKAYELNVADTLSFLLKNSDGKTATVQGIYTEPVLDYNVEQSISCTLRGTKGVSRAGYPLLKYETNFEANDGKCISHEFNDKEDYYFRFENKS